MTQAFSAFIEGLRRAARAPALLAGLLVAGLLLALPASHLVEHQVAASLGHSQAAGRMADGVDSEWWDHFLEGASGLGESFTPAVIGFAAVLDNLSRFADRQAYPPAVAALVFFYLLAWLFLIGGVLDRLARNRPLRAAAFFAACGTYFVRFLRLGLLAGAGYAVLFGWVHGWLFGTVYRWATIDLTVERRAFAVRLLLYAVFSACVAAWTLMFDYAKVRAVVEDRRSMLGAWLAGSRFVLRHPKKTGTLWLLNAAALLIVVAVYGLVAPGAAGAGGAAWLAFAAGQVYVILRLILKMAGYGSQVALFQGMLAHAEYTAAAPAPEPEPPVVEAFSR